jgi:predicted ATPase
MIKSVRLKNFKCFRDIMFELKPLTLLSGLNGVGKSSLLQSLLLLRQSHQRQSRQREDSLKDLELELNGDLVQVGTARDVLFENAENQTLSIGIVLNDGDAVWEFDCADRDNTCLRNLSGKEKSAQTSLFADDFQYLQAERFGPRVMFEMSDYQVRQRKQLGVRGEYTAHFLSLFEREKIHSKKLAFPDVKKVAEASHDLIDQVEAWLGVVSPGTRIHSVPQSEIDSVRLRYSFPGVGGRSNEYRATNVGFGVTYALPVIVALLASPSKSLILLENPEAHLHPKGQAKIGELIARAVASGSQVLVETHSDHVLNGIRLAVHGGILAPDDVQVHYFSRVKESEIEVVSPKIDRNGRFDFWPEGFFDEWDNSLEKLLEPRIAE